MKTYPVQLSGEQAAAVALFAKKFRLSMEESIAVLAFQLINTSHDAEDFPQFVDDALECVRSGRAFYSAEELVCGLPELDMAPEPSAAR